MNMLGMTVPNLSPTLSLYTLWVISINLAIAALLKVSTYVCELNHSDDGLGSTYAYQVCSPLSSSGSSILLPDARLASSFTMTWYLASKEPSSLRTALPLADGAGFSL